MIYERNLILKVFMWSDEHPKILIFNRYEIPYFHCKKRCENMDIKYDDLKCDTHFTTEYGLWSEDAEWNLRKKEWMWLDRKVLIFPVKVMLRNNLCA